MLAWLRVDRVVGPLGGGPTDNQYVPKHPEGVDGQLDLAPVPLFGSDADLYNLQVEPVGEEEEFGVEREAIQAGLTEQL